MREMILSTNTLPEPLLGLISSPQIRVQETEMGIILMPVDEEHLLKAIKQARGMYTDGKLSVDQFLAEKRAEEAGK